MVRRHGCNLCIPGNKEVCVDRPLCLIVNPAARNGRGRALLAPATSVLAQAGQDHRVVESQSLLHARELAAQAADRGELAGAAAACDAHYGLIPIGRGNDLACVLGIPSDPAAAARVLAVGRVRQVDLIGVSTPDTAEVVVAGSVYAGIPAVAGEIANETRWLGGSLVYPVAALRALARWKPVRFAVAIEGTDGGHDFEGYAVVVANSPLFGAGMRVAPPAVVDDGLLDVVLMQHAAKLTFVKALMKIKDGTHVALPQIELHRGADVTVTMSRNLPAAADGEPLACASPLPAGIPLRIRVLPGVLKALVPAQSCPL
jgi:diacylglycerol kinase (ATP)